MPLLHRQCFTARFVMSAAVKCCSALLMFGPDGDIVILLYPGSVVLVRICISHYIFCMGFTICAWSIRLYRRLATGALTSGDEFCGRAPGFYCVKKNCRHVG